MANEVAVIARPAPRQEVSIAQTFGVMMMDQADILQAVQENLAGSELGTFSLDRIKVPSGGGTTWEVPTLDGIAEMKVVTGVVIFHQLQRSYWSQELEAGQSVPPDCTSVDAVIGVGDPGGECAKCPLAKFGTATKNGKPAKGQACKQMRILWMIRPDSFMPVIISVPPTSLRPFQDYLMRLAGEGMPISTVLTNLKLIKREGPPAYAEIVPGFGGKLPASESSRLRQLSDALAPILRRQTIEHDALDGAATPF